MSNADSQGPLSLEERWQMCKIQDDHKASLIEDLFSHIAELSDKLSEVKMELKEKRMLDKHCFAMVLVDGDCMPFSDDLANNQFLDDLIEQGLEGGKKAASLLRLAVFDELKAIDPCLPHHLQLAVRVYANLKGLAKTYTEMGIIPDPSVLDDFVRGFNMWNAMCDFVDAGNGKECTDEKLKANFESSVSDVHCRHVLFGGSADSGYARVLGSYLDNDEIRKKVVLLEGPPFAQELAEIKDQFRVASFNRVFRRQKLFNNIKRKVSYNITPPLTPSPNYASAAARAPSVLAGDLPVRQQAMVDSRMPPLGQVLRNKAGQRIDPPLDFTHQEFILMKNRKLCNSLHLLGRCPYREAYGKCSHEHKGRLSPKELQVLWAVARQSHCHTGLSCTDPNCVFGHQCPRESCNGASCRLRFPLELHNIDKRPTR
ncbi:CCCH zinc finger DNA binding protein [Colletotrichum paranaense]|uniref:CCCH zinc finger DNA binding protein n=1 Tax=Colletotrichum paranaense TaxID=1914294 RepID=A0ABQ9SD15_9PEZI|nr:CCCH zinc finger DNA binding protein [Colletotrichum paranaense]KAK1531790.1 CCCH zinc finger DNA binding protein [Colletotrichum paranaense]